MIGSLTIRAAHIWNFFGWELPIANRPARHNLHAAAPEQTRRAVPLYRWLLGDDFDRLPAAVQRFHTTGAGVTASGTATVTHGYRWPARALTRLLGFPSSGTGRALRVTVTEAGGVERLTRHYPETSLTTWQEAAGTGLLRERFGPFGLSFRLEARAHGLCFMLREARLFGMRLPLALAPRIQARETADDGTYRFFVRVDLPLFGRLIQYQGCLTEIGDG